MQNQSERIDPETILLTLDQVSQTIEIMTSVVSQLKSYLSVHLEDLQLELNLDAETTEEAVPEQHCNEDINAIKKTLFH